MYRLRWLGVVSAVILISGCQSLPPAPTPLPVAPTAAPAVQVAPTAQVSPLTVPTAAIDASPVVTPEASALPTVDAQGRRFEIERPVKASDTVIKGTGLPGIPLEVHDVTRMGAQLGGGTVGEDGRFEITVAEVNAERPHRHHPGGTRRFNLGQSSRAGTAVTRRSHGRRLPRHRSGRALTRAARRRMAKQVWLKSERTV